MGWVAQIPDSSFPFLFDFGLGLGTWTRACQISFLGSSEIHIDLRENSTLPIVRPPLPRWPIEKV